MPETQVVIASRDESLLAAIEDVLTPEGLPTQVEKDQAELIRLFHSTLLQNTQRIILIVDGDLQMGSKKRKSRKDIDMSGHEAAEIIESHTSAYDTASLAERNAELVMHLLERRTGITPVMFVTDREKGQLSGGEFTEIIFVSESDVEEDGYWSIVLDQILRPKEEK